MSIYHPEFVDRNQGARLPSSAYRGKNGFNPPRVEPPPDGETPSLAALAQHRTAMYILTQKDRPIPSYDIGLLIFHVYN
jgi:hypothetical protein